MQKLLLVLAVTFTLVTSTDVAFAKVKTKASAPEDGATPKKKKEASKAAVSAQDKTSPPAAGEKQAKGRKGKNAKKLKAAGALPPTAETVKAIENLKSVDPEVVIEAISTLGASGAKEAAQPLVTLLATGPRSDITDAAIYALGGIDNEDAVGPLIDYLGFRRSDTRIAALFGLEKFKGEKVTKAIEAALRDSDHQVRSTAALAIGKRGDVGSVPILFLAFERGVTDAAIAIGQLGNDEDAKRLATHLGRVDIKVMLAGFEEFLKRDNFPEDAKLNILNRLFDLAGPDVWRFAVTYKASFPPDTDENENKLYKLVSRMVRQIKDK